MCIRDRCHECVVSCVCRGNVTAGLCVWSTSEVMSMLTCVSWVRSVVCVVAMLRRLYTAGLCVWSTSDVMSMLTRVLWVCSVVCVSWHRLYTDGLCVASASKYLEYTVTRGSHSFTCHPHTNHTCPPYNGLCVSRLFNYIMHMTVMLNLLVVCAKTWVLHLAILP